MMDIEEDQNEFNQQQKRIYNDQICMFEMLVNLLQVNPIKKQSFSYHQLNQQTDLMEQIGQYNQNRKKQEQIEQMIQNQTNLYKQYQQEIRDKQQQNSLYELIQFRHQLREKQLKQIQYNYQDSSFNNDLSNLDLTQEEIRQLNQNRIIHSQNNLNINNNDSSKNSSENESTLNINNQHQNSVETNYYDEESFNTFDQSKMSLINNASIFDSEMTYNYNNYQSNKNQMKFNDSDFQNNQNTINQGLKNTRQNESHYNSQFNNTMVNQNSSINFEQRTQKLNQIQEQKLEFKNQIIISNLQLLKFNGQNNESIIDNSIQEKENEQTNQDNEISEKTGNNDVKNEQEQFSKAIFKIQPQKLRWNEKIQICGGLVLYEGVLRNQKGLIHLSFGFQQEQIVQVEDKMKLNVVCVQMQPEINAKEPSLDEAINYLESYLSSCASLQYIDNKIPSYSSQQFKEQIKPNSLALVKDKISNHMKHRQQFKDVMKNFVFDENILKWKDDNFNVFVDQCYKYLIQYDTNQTQMYQYCICKFNYYSQDIQMFESGYSKPYLNLLGIDVETFRSMMMRGQKIDLIKSNEAIHQQTLYTMLQCLFNVNDVEIFTDIYTFDGFPLNLYQKQKKIDIPMSKEQNSCEYYLFITEIDVSVNDLQQLILYRQNISQQNEQLSYEDFIRKELSYIFEDVEYSVHSQSFLEKYYKENLQKLQDIRQIQQQQQHKHLKSKEKKAIAQNIFKPVQYSVVPI